MTKDEFLTAKERLKELDDILLPFKEEYNEKFYEHCNFDGNAYIDWYRRSHNFYEEYKKLKKDVDMYLSEHPEDVERTIPEMIRTENDDEIDVSKIKLVAM